MVSLWPWKSNDTTSSFEKTLSAVSGKITKANADKEALGARSRRLKALWTIYTTLAYIFSSLILVLVTGWQNWGAVEYGVVTGAPFLIYAGRTALSYYYNYRLSNNQVYLNSLIKQRNIAIEKFKTATKYNTTQQLLEKYGAAPSSSTTSLASPLPVSSNLASSSNVRSRPTRTNIPPPPTANIRRIDEAAPTLGTPRQPYTGSPSFSRQSFSPAARPDPLPTEEFAPNAFSASPQYSTGVSHSSHGHKWYDRILDVILGEDENRPTNRLALICTHCRLVNGLAPPGTKTLEAVGKWRCSGCGTMNGEHVETKRIMEAISVKGNATGESPSTSEIRAESQHENEEGVLEMEQKSGDDSEDSNSAPSMGTPNTRSKSETDAETAEDTSDGESLQPSSPARSTRSRAKRTKKI